MTITLKKSSIGQTSRIKKTLKVLKLTRLHKQVEVDANNKALMGMVKKIEHLIEITK